VKAKKEFDALSARVYNVITIGGTTNMKARIVKIGNSQGIRLPKPLVEQTGLGEEVVIEVQGNRLIITPAARTRALWVAAFKEMAKRGDDASLDDDLRVPTLWEKDGWEWS
jgi:antitoxin MazE